LELYPILPNLGKSFNSGCRTPNQIRFEILRSKLKIIWELILVSHHIGFDTENDAKACSPFGIGKIPNPMIAP